MPFVCFKRGLLGLPFYWKAQTSIWADILLSDMYGTWEMRGHDSTRVLEIFFFFWVKNDGHGRTRLGHGLCRCYQKKKIVTHYLSHQSPPTSSHTDLLCHRSSSHSDLSFFFSSVYFSFAVSPLPLFLFCFSLLYFLFIFSCFTLSHV